MHHVKGNMCEINVEFKQDVFLYSIWNLNILYAVNGRVYVLMEGVT